MDLGTTLTVLVGGGSTAVKFAGTRRQSPVPKVDDVSIKSHFTTTETAQDARDLSEISMVHSEDRTIEKARAVSSSLHHRCFIAR